MTFTSLAPMYFLLSLLITYAFSSAVHSSEIVVFAAASLTDALKELAPTYEKSTGDKLAYNFGASSTLAVQIREGAPADVFFSADEAKMNELARRNLIANDTRKSLLGNSLVVVTAGDSTLTFHSITNLKSPTVKKIALAEPQSVPAGIYSRTHLQKLGLWNAVIDKVIPTENVRAALAAVEAGNVDVAMVYKTDALISKKVKILIEIPAQEGPVILYPVAVTSNSKAPDKSRHFVSYLSTPAALASFQRHGFLISLSTPQTNKAAERR